MPQVISHSRDLGIGNDLTNRFCDSIIQLKEKLGVTFMQMPPHFGYDRLPLLSTFLKRFPTKDIPLAIEVRHQEWFANPDYFKALLDLLYEYQVSTVITDVAGRRDVLHLALTTPIALIRFVGNGLHPTDYQRVDDWIDLLKDWTARGLEEFYFFSHQPDNILSPQMCIYFQQQLEEKCGFQFSKKTKKVVDTQMRLF